MSLLREIQDAATSSGVQVSVALRKERILAARLGHEPLKRWVGNELDGYANVLQGPEDGREGHHPADPPL